MKKAFNWVFVSLLVLVLVGYLSVNSVANQALGAASTQQIKTKSDDKLLPSSYPSDILPLPADAEIFIVLENPGNNGLEVAFVSDYNFDTLCDYYAKALKGAHDLMTIPSERLYMIGGQLEGVGYMIMVSKDAMNPNPQYVGKISVYIILTGLKGVSSDKTLEPSRDGNSWPSADLPGVPKLPGHISYVLRQDDIVLLEIQVEATSVVETYLDDLKGAGFSFDGQPVRSNEHIQVIAFKDSSILNFSYNVNEKTVYLEFMK